MLQNATADVAVGTSRERTIACVLLGFTMVVWGGSFVAARALLAPANPADPALSPTVLAAVRFVIAGAMFAPILIARYIRNGNGQGTTRKLTARDLLWLVALGQLGITVYFWLQYTGVRMTSAGVASILVVGLIPIATAITAQARLNEPFRRVHIAALILGLAGVIVVTLQRDSGASFTVSRSFALGALALLGNAVAFAIYSTLVRGARERFDTLTLTSGTMISGAVGLTALAVVAGGWRAVGTLTTTQWGWILFLSLICSVAGYFLYNHALSVLEAGKAATWVYIEVPVALFLGALILAEPITLPSIAGGLIIAAAVVVVSRAK